jgi:hypothetical protein
MANKHLTLEYMATPTYQKLREKHNKWWSNICKLRLEGFTFEEATEILNKKSKNNKL